MPLPPPRLLLLLRRRRPLTSTSPSAASAATTATSPSSPSAPPRPRHPHTAGTATTRGSPTTSASSSARSPPRAPCPTTGVPLETVFFGGGTPSLVPPRLVAAVLDALRTRFGLSASPEVSIEMDPGTFDAAKLRELVGLGVNRVSLGVQAFQEDLLRACGRAHGLREVHDAVGIVTACEGLQNWSMDLISSLPNQTEEMWEESLRCTVDARPTHVSVYDLQIEQGTKFGQLWVEPIRLTLNPVLDKVATLLWGLVGMAIWAMN
ncbi:hypothetical protein OsJ_17667 [Oryza sativa Japonica Group]|uniref:Elp3/MiaA/NifB-like radical SAM core domain-containing protein n=1 Tax=Oryza sativa subsp. japonica TaxID=39947 RepID=B9FNA6_ORYSJ|nr:hypothetical protein OsJ_17667 [Oryza sativa Japonica Group]